MSAVTDRATSRPIIAAKLHHTTFTTLSQTLTLFPGDLIFTGTPSGVGLGKTPPVYLRRGQTLVTRIEGIGELRNRLVEPDRGHPEPMIDLEANAR